MTLSLDEFWRLAQQSQLVEANEAERLQSDFATSGGGDVEPVRLTAAAAAEWLIKRHKLTPYQARVLLRGKPGPFQFGEYRILKLHPAPSVATRRFDGLHVGTNHRVLLHFWLDTADESWQHAAHQAELARRMRHPNLDRVYEIVATEDYRLAASQWPEGRTLSALLSERKHLPVPHACLLIQQLATALAHMHALGAVHGQLQPDEVVVQSGGHVQLLRQPFYSPMPLVLEQLQASGGRAAVLYLAPEFLQPGTLPDRLTDIYALGCLLYQLVCGCPPYQADTVEQLMAEHATRRITPLEQHVRAPAALTEVVSFMMAKRRELRFQDMTDVIDKLSVFLPSGIRQTTPRSRATESYYLAHLETKASNLPNHLVPHVAQPAAAPPPQQSPPSPPSPPPSSPSPPPATAQGPVEAPRLANGQSQQDETTGVIPAEPVLVVSGTGLSSNLRRPRRQTPWRAPLIGAVAMCALIALLWFLRPGGPATQTNQLTGEAKSPGDLPANPSTARDSAPPGTPPASEVESTLSVTLVDDDGQTLWMSPTHADPVDLSLTPPGAQFFVHVRLAALSASPEGAAALRALGPDFARLQDNFLTDLGLQPAEVDRLLLAFASRDGDAPQMTAVLQLSTDARQRVWERTDQRMDRPSGQLGQLGAATVFFPTAAAQLVVLGHRDRVEEVCGATGPPPMRREIEMLRRASDADRHVTLLVAPNFLAADGRSLMDGPAQPLRQPLLDFLGDSALAACFSIHLATEGTYLELRWIAAVDDPPVHIAADRRRQVEGLPERVNDVLGRLPIDPYWQPLAIRLPLMVHFLGQQVRTGVEGPMVILNAVLPPSAATNLILASQLALSSSTSLAPRDRLTDVAPTSMSIDQLLAQPTTLVIQQQSLEGVVEELAGTVRQQTGNRGFSIRIVGEDLQLDGITRNQQIRDLRLQAQPIRVILTELVRRANPKPVTDPRQPEQKLVWVVSPTDAAGILITTRSAVSEKSLTLPDEFVAGSGSTGLE